MQQGVFLQKLSDALEESKNKITTKLPVGSAIIANNYFWLHGRKAFKKKKKNRCCFEGCKKKLTLTQQTMKCKCQMCFCSKHFHAEEHACTFNYKAFSKENFENLVGLGGGQFSKLESI